MTAKSFVPDRSAGRSSQSSKTRRSCSAPTLTPAAGQAAAHRRRRCWPPSRTAPRDMEQVATQAASRRRRSRRRCDHVLARGAATLPALKDEPSVGLERRLDDLRLSLQAEPVTLDEPAATRSSATGSRPTAGRASRSSPRATRATTRCCAASLPRCAKIAPDATGAPVTIQESAHTVTQAFVVAGIIALAAISVLLARGAAAAVRTCCWYWCRCCWRGC